MFSPYGFPMKQSIIPCALLLAACSLSANLQAQNFRYLAGVKYSAYSFDLTGTTQMDDSEGYALSGRLLMKQGLAMEFEYGKSGKADFAYGDGAILGGRLQSQNLAAYGAYRTPGAIYGKVKAGVTINWIDVSDLQCATTFCVDTLSSDGGGFTYGLGAGARFADRIFTELEYVVIDPDIELLQLGVLIAF